MLHYIQVIKLAFKNVVHILHFIFAYTKFQLQHFVKINTIHMWSPCGNEPKYNVLHYTEFLGRLGVQ